MKKYVLAAVLLFSFSSVANANVICNETKQEISSVKTTEGYLYTTKAIVDNIANLNRHTVIIILKEGDVYHRGAGTVLDKRHILTVKHAVESTKKDHELFYFSSDGASPLYATVTKLHPTLDLAIIEIDEKAPDLIEPMSFNDAIVDETVYTIGHPLTGIYSLTQGTVANEGGRLNLPVHPGNSGGLVMNRKGELVGIIYEMYHDETRSLMVPAKDILDFIKG
jgi:S1-C subfamily serine protease